MKNFIAIFRILNGCFGLSQSFPFTLLFCILILVNVVIITQTVWNTPKYFDLYFPVFGQNPSNYALHFWILNKFGKVWVKVKEIPIYFWYKSKRYSLPDHLHLLQISIWITQFFTYFMPLVSFDTPWKHQKTNAFLMFSGGVERDQWHEMG